MVKAIELLKTLGQCLSKTVLRQLSSITPAILSMSGRITMLGISRWTTKGGSYRTVQRFFNTVIEWPKTQWTFISHWLLEPDDVLIVAGDETVVTKSGTETFGLNKFFSSIFGKTVPGISFFALSLISVKKRLSFPILVRQMLRSPKDEEVGKSKKKRSRTKKKKPQGRPKGSKNKNRKEVELSHYLCVIQEMLLSVLQLVGDKFKLIYCVLDGAFGHNYALQMVGRCGMHLISKLQANSALYFPYTGSYSGRGPRKKYGDKIHYDNIPPKYLKETTTQDGIRTQIYQMTMLHKLFPQPLNVVIIVKTHLKSKARAHVILFSSDINLSYELLIDYYRLRFQIEFNFREAKQHWGLEDFMNIKELPLTNAVNLSFFMVNFSKALTQQFRDIHPNFSVEDLKAHFRGLKYINETLKFLPEKPDPILIQNICDQVTKIGGINVA